MNIKISYLSCVLFCALSFVAKAQLLSFARYRVDIYKGHKAKLIIKGNKLAEQYRTVITNTYYSTKEQTEWHGATGLNFAGHYCFVYWGCGSDCQHSAVIDLKTGIVYDGLMASRGFDFKKNSLMVIVNPGTTNNECAFCKEELWLWGIASKKFTKLRSL